MAEAYESKSNSYTDTYSGQTDPTNLYIRNIPADLTEDSFLSLLSENGSRRISSHRLYPPKDSRDVTIGLVSFERAEDALQIKSSLHNRPPMYLKIEFAKSKPKNTTSKHSHEQGSMNPSINERGHQAVPGALGRGRSLIQGMSNQNNLPSAGRGQIGLTVHLEGDRRIAYQSSEPVNTLRESTYSPDLPDLIPNLCLFCKKKGDLLCGNCRQPYCSANCQRLDWPKHESSCKSVSSSISKQKQFANDSSYMSEGSSSDTDKKMNNNLSMNRPVHRNQSGSLAFEHKQPGKPRVSEASPIKPHMHSKETPSNSSGTQRKIIKANEVQEQVLSSNKPYKVSVCKSYSPSEFWIHLDGAAKTLYEMEKEMNSQVLKNPVKCAVDDICCTFENGKFMRVRILKLTPNTAIVKYIDYGGTSDLLNNKLYFLPELFKKYPAQAIACNLVDGMNQENVVWSDEEISSFSSFHTKNKVFTGHVHGSVKNVYNIALINDEGVSLYSILRFSHMEELGGLPQSNSSVTTIPSVLSDLKQEVEVTIRAVEYEEDKFWGFLENGSRAIALKDLQNLLQNVETEDISLTCEEGDTAVGFSPSFNQFYRCVILKRLRSSFLVRYIDYGNSEKITKLQILSPVLLQKKSYVICCEKPTSLSIEDIKLAFETTCLATVKNINSMGVELSFSYKNKSIVMCCYPWYHGTTIGHSIKLHSNGPSQQSSNLVESKHFQPSRFPRKKISLSPKQVLSKSETLHQVVITKKDIADRDLDANLKHDVNIIVMNGVSEIYVQLIADKVTVNKLTRDLNKYCNSEPFSEYFPVIDEIICCKFADDWCRAQVIGRNKDKFKVLYIDYGNYAEASVKDIKPLPQKFAFAKLAICVSLCGIKNDDFVGNQELLDKLLTDTLSMELKDVKQTPAKVMFYLKEKPLTALVGKKKSHSKAMLQFQELPVGISEVILSYSQADQVFVQQKKDLESLIFLQNKIKSLVKTDVSKPEIDMVYCCLSGDGDYYRGLVKKILSKSIQVNYIDYGNDEEILINNVKELSDDLFSHPVYCVPLKFQNCKLSDLQQETVFSVEVIGKNNGTQLVNILKDHQNAAKLSISDLKSLCLEEGINGVKFSFYENEVFFCHLQKHFSDLEILNQKLANSQCKPLNQNPTKGDLVCAKSSDGNWYRASVQSSSEKDLMLNVLFIDYGNSEDVSSENIKCLPEDLLNFPVLCVPVKAANIEQAQKELDMTSVLHVKTVGFSKNNMQLVEFILPSNKILPKPNKIVLPKSNSLKKQMLPTDQEIDVSLCYTQGDILYVQMASSKELLTTLEAKLTKASEFSDLTDLPEIGDLICAKFLDGIWYRGSVEKVINDQKSCEICFIDYGNSEVISMENIKCLPEDLLHFPVLCIPVKAANIEQAKEGLDMTSVLHVKTVGFSKDNVQLVEFVLPSNTILPKPNKIALPKSNSLKKQMLPTDQEIDVSLCHKQDEILYVQMASSKELLTTLEAKLAKASEFNDISNLPEIGDLICAKFIDGIWYRGSVEKVINDQNSCEICFIDYGNSEVISLENMKILPTSLCTFPVLSVPVKFRNMETLLEKIQAGEPVFSVRVIDSSDTLFVVDIAVPEEVIELAAIQSEKLPESPVEVTIVHKEADVFYVQKVSNAEKLAEMMVDLQKPIFLKKLLRNPKVGELCNVKFMGDGQFYRAVIKEQCSGNTFKAFFVDYGNFDVVEPINIYAIPSKYSSVSALCTAVQFKNLNDFSVFSSNPLCKIKYTGISNGDVHVVELCPAVSPIPISALKQSNLDAGELNVTFLSFDGEFHFLHKLSDSSKIIEMNSILEKFEGDVISGIPAVDEVLVVKSQNHSWCRGCIKAVNNTSKTCKVFLIDYGTAEEVPLCEIYYMSEKLSAFPVFSIKVTIKDSTFMAESVSFGKQYSAAVIATTADGIPIIEIFKRYMLSLLKQQKLLLNELSNVVFYHQEGDIFFLQEVNNAALVAEVQTEVRKQASSSPISHKPIVGELLCAKSQADNSWYRCCVEEAVSADKWKIRFIDYGNDETVVRENLRPFLGELAMHPSFSIPVRIVNNEGVKSTVQFEKVYSVIAESSENNVQLVKIMIHHESRSHIPSEDACKIENSTNLETKSLHSNPTDGENSESKVTSLLSSTNTIDKYYYSTSDYVDFPDGDQDIIIYSVNEECSLFCAPFNPEAITANLGLSAEITKYCENVQSFTFEKDSLPELDELVLAKYDGDSQWYRAVVVDDGFHPHYDVVFVDYGNAERVHIDYMRKMVKDFMKLPVQAHLCSITGFSIDWKLLPDVIKILKSFGIFVSTAPLKATVTSNGEDKFVNIPVITEHLLEKKLVTVSES